MSKHITNEKECDYNGTVQDVQIFSASIGMVVAIFVSDLKNKLSGF